MGFKEILIKSGLTEDEARLINNLPTGNANTVLLAMVLSTLREMKKQEFNYWEAWKKAKTTEQQRLTEVAEQ